MYTCDNLTVTPGQYAAIQSGSCDQSVPGSCFVGGTVYDLGFFTAVKYGDCSSTCSEAPEVSICLRYQIEICKCTTNGRACANTRCL